jgi:hypothetical protein
MWPYRLIGSLFIVALSLSFLTRPGWCDQPSASSLFKSPEWLRLGHYRKKLFGGYQSTIDDPGFFLSPDGKTNPQKELEATLQELQNPSGIQIGHLKQQIHCAFPARVAWLKTKLPISVSNEPCQDRDDWIRGISAKSVTLVFSSSYPNNPASMFGHTLLRLNRGSANSILDYGANFEARVPASDPTLIYAIKGLLGFYTGEFSFSPYYMKVNEYSYSESRDLWEYDLNLTPEQVTRLVDHLWELYASAGFNYYFLDENCSYQLLALLEVANPNWDLLSPRWLVVIPIDTLKQIQKQPQAILQERLRPSLFHRMKSRLSLLDSEQEKEWQGVISLQKDLKQVGTPKVLNAVISYLDYQRQKKKGDLSPSQDQLFRASLVRRAQLGQAKEANEEPQPQSPTNSPLSTHDSSVVALGSRIRNQQFALGLEGRLAFHDFLDPSPGYPPGLQVEAGSLRMDYYVESKTLRLEELKLLNVLSLHPANSIDLQYSWTFRSGVSTLLDFGCFNCLGGRIEAGGGLSVSFLDRKFWIYGMALATVDYIPDLTKAGRYGPTGEVGVVLHPLASVALQSSFRLQSELNHPLSRGVFSEWKTGASLSFSRNSQVRVSYTTYGTWLEGVSPSDLSTDLRFYF